MFDPVFSLPKIIHGPEKARWTVSNFKNIFQLCFIFTVFSNKVKDKFSVKARSNSVFVN